MQLHAFFPVWCSNPLGDHIIEEVYVWNARSRQCTCPDLDADGPSVFAFATRLYPQRSIRSDV
jgi:hypothetical protein